MKETPAGMQYTAREMMRIEEAVQRRVLPVFHDMVAELLVDLNLPFAENERMSVGGTAGFALVDALLRGWSRNLAALAEDEDADDAYVWLAGYWYRRLPDWWGVDFQVGHGEADDTLIAHVEPVLGRALGEKLAIPISDTCRGMEIAMLNVKVDHPHGLAMAMLAGVVAHWARHLGINEDITKQHQWLAALSRALGLEMHLERVDKRR